MPVDYSNAGACSSESVFRQQASPDELREWANRIEADLKAARKKTKAHKREAKAAAKRRQAALDALVRIARVGEDDAAVEAAKALLA